MIMQSVHVLCTDCMITEVGVLSGARLGVDTGAMTGSAHSLLIVHVDVAVAPDRVEDFLAATELNATASRGEPGVVRFDVLTDRDDPGHVVLVEIYRDERAAADHKQTAHYATWRDTVAPMMARPRSSAKLINRSPDDAGW